MKTPRMLSLAALLLLTLTGNAQTPVSWWQAEGDAQDARGLNHGEVPAPFSYGPGAFDEAFMFGGANIDIADAQDLNPENVTVQAWVKADGTPGAFRYLLNKTRPEGTWSYAIYTGGTGGLVFLVWLGDAGLVLSPAATAEDVWDGKWHQVTATYDGSVARLYVDGVEIGSGTEAAGKIDYTDAGPLVLGDYQVAGGLSYRGALDEVKIFGRALPAEDVLTTFNDPSDPVATDGLAGWWRGEGDARDSWNDHHGVAPEPQVRVEYLPGRSGLAFFPRSPSDAGTVRISADESLHSGHVTVEAWVNSVAPGAFRYIINKGGSPAGVSYGLYTGPDGGLLFLVRVDENFFAFSSPVDAQSVWDGSWRHIVATYDGNAVRLYLDGTEIGTGTERPGSIDHSSPGPLVFGDYVGGGLPFSGGIDEVKVYDHALTAEQVEMKYAEGLSAEASLVSWWRAEGDAADAIGGNGGALVGNASFGFSRSFGMAFDTVGGVIEIPDAADLQPQTISVEALVLGVSPGNNKYIVSKSLTDQNASYALSTGPDGGLVFSISTSDGVFSSPSASSNIWDGHYHAVAGTYDGERVRLYVDGSEVSSGTSASGTLIYGNGHNGGNLLLGDFSSSPGTGNFNGLVDEVKIYAGAVTSEEIQANAFSPILVVEQPQDATAAAGTDISFNVLAQGPAPLEYQWQFEGTDLPDATGPALALNAIQPDQGGQYTVRISRPSLQYADGVTGDAFDLAGGIVRIPNTPELSPDNITIQAWVRADGSPGGSRYLLAKTRMGLPHDVETPSYGFWTGAEGGISLLITGFYDGLAVSPAAAPEAVWDGKWHQVTGTYDGSKIAMYLDGELVGSGSTWDDPIDYNSEWQNGDLLLGSLLSTPGGGFQYTGDMDEVRIYNRVLSAQEILESFADLSTASTSGLIGWWQADGNTLDSFGSNHAQSLPPQGMVISQPALLTVAADGVIPEFENVGVVDDYFQATLTGPTGDIYTIQRSSDLVNWEPFLTDTVPFEIRDSVAGKPRQFYRAIPQP